METLNLRVLPLEILEFQENYKVYQNTKEAYLIYLKTNREHHHYNGATLKEWAKAQIEHL